ncbi:MAG: hypothetical protein AAGA71_07480 [Pseudomonadota bacterium]
MITRKLIVAAGVAVTCLLATGVRGDENGDFDFHYSAQDLATQTDYPFMYSGRVINEQHLQWDNYRRTLQKFPDAQSCLTRGSRTGDQFDLTQFSWRGLRGSREIQVCLFRVATTLRDVDKMAAWLTTQEFEYVGINETAWSSIAGNSTERRVSGRWSIQKMREKRVGWPLLYSLYVILPPRFFSVSVTFGDTNEVFATSASAQSK